MLKILHISPRYFSKKSVIGGGEKYIVYLIRAISTIIPKLNEDVEQVVLSFGDEDRLIKQEGYCIKILNAEPEKIENLRKVDISLILSEYDLIFVHQCLTDFGLFFASLSQIQNKTVIGLDHGGGLSRIINTSPSVLSVYDALLAQSDFASYAYQSTNVLTIIDYGPIDCEQFRNITQEKDKNLIVSVGRILPHKGFETVIKALSNTEYQYVIIGRIYDDEYYRYLLKMAAELKTKLTIAVDFDDLKVKEYMAKSYLYIQPSTHSGYKGQFYQKPELLGLAALEALASGTITLVSQAGALPELKRNFGCETFDNFQELRNLIFKYMATPLNRYESTKIKDSVERNYGLSQFGECLLEFIKACNRI